MDGDKIETTRALKQSSYRAETAPVPYSDYSPSGVGTQTQYLTEYEPNMNDKPNRVEPNEVLQWPRCARNALQEARAARQRFTTARPKEKHPSLTEG